MKATTQDTMKNKSTNKNMSTNDIETVLTNFIHNETTTLMFYMLMSIANDESGKERIFLEKNRKFYVIRS